MSPIENERFIEIIGSRFKHPIDELWGPIGPNVRTRAHLRELQLAWSVASLADLLELAQEGLGKSLLTKFVEEPEGPCPPWPTPLHWPPKKGGGEPDPEPEPEPIDPAVLGAALVFVAKFVRSPELANIATTSGREMIG